MSRFVRAAGVCAVGLAVAQVDLAAQERNPQAPSPFIARIDAVAVDALGRTVTDLKREDFEIFEDGRARPIESVSFFSSTVPAGGGHVARLLGIYLDEYHLSAGPGLDRVLAALDAFIGREFGDDGRLAVVRALDLLPRIRLTGDQDAAREALMQVAPRKGDYAPRNTFERDFIASSPRRIESGRAQIAISALNALATQLGGLEAGRKTLLVISEGIAGAPRRRGEEGLPSIDTVIRTANRGGVSIYAIDPRSLDSSGASGTDMAGHDMLRAMASETEGRVLLNAIDASGGDRAVARIVADASGYYLIAFEAGTSSGRGRLHPVQVRVKRPGVELRVRKGYWSPLPVPVRPATAWPPRHLPALTARPSRFTRTWFGATPKDDGQTRVQFVWEPAAGVPGDRSRSEAATRLTLSVYTGNGTTLLTEEVEPAGSPGANGTRVVVFDAAPGRYRVQMSIYDARSRLIDTDVRDLVVRPRTSAVAIGSPEVYRARTAREFREMDASPGARLPAATRDFIRTDRLLIRVPVQLQGARLVARLVSQFGSVMRELPVSIPASRDVAQIDLPLAGLATGGYRIELDAAGAAGRVQEHLAFRVVP